MHLQANYGDLYISDPRYGINHAHMHGTKGMKTLDTGKIRKIDQLQEKTHNF